MPRAGIFGKSDVAANASGQSNALPSTEYRGVAKIVASAPGRVEVVATSAEGGLLVVHDIDYPGWFAQLDGKPTPILRADILFRAVEIPPGTHRVRFRFAPFSLAYLHAALKAVLGRTTLGP
jgi:hypothetical protein